MAEIFMSNVGVSVELAPGADRTADPSTWVWQEITTDAQIGSGITTTVGRRDDASRVDAGKCSMTLDNTGGHYCRTNPNGRWYGQLTKNTPLRVRIRPVQDLFARTTSSGWGAATSGQAWTSGGGSASDYSTDGSTGLVSMGSVNVSRRLTLAGDYRDIEMVATVSVPTVATGAPIRSALLLRTQSASTDHYRAQIDWGLAGALSVTLVKRVSGVDTTLDTQVLAATYSAGTKVTIRANVTGSMLRARAWLASGSEPAAWDVEAADTTFVGAGPVGFRMLLSTGNTNSLPVVISVDDVAAHVDRFGGDVPELPPRWDLSGRIATVPITAAGIIRRLGQGKSPLRPAIERSIIADAPLHYWPLNDGEDAAAFASGLPSGTPMAYKGAPLLSAADGLSGWGGKYVTTRQADAQIGTLYSDITMLDNNGWIVEIWANMSVPVLPGATFAQLLSWTTSTGSGRWEITASDNDFVAGEFFIDLWRNFNGSGSTGKTITVATTGWHYMRAEMRMSGGIPYLTWTVDGATNGPTDLSAEVSAPGTIINVTTDGIIFYDADRIGLDTTSLGHLSIYNTSIASHYNAGLGYAGETASDRILRLCAEENIPAFAVAGTSETMGPQPAKTLLELLRECEDADQGMLYEASHGFGYQPRSARYNATYSMIIDGATQLASAPEPVDDDQRLRNDVTVSRPAGSSSRYVASGAMSPEVVGRADEAITANIETDAVLAQHAQWRVGLGTQNDMRWPSISLNLAATPELIPAWLCVRPGDRIQVTGPPAEAGADSLDLVVEGWTERISDGVWTASLCCSPGNPYRVAVVAGVGGASSPPWRVEAGSVTLASSATTTATSLSAATGSGPLLSTAAADYPCDIGVGGEQITVTAVSGAVSPQTLTVVRSVNGVVKAHNAGTSVYGWQLPAIAL